MSRRVVAGSLLAGLLAVGALTGACGAPPATDGAPGGATSASSPRGSARAAPLAWEGCNPAPVECATLAVPLDPARPDGPTVDLALARRPAREPDRRLGSLVVDPGGPGASGVSYLRNGGLATALNDRFDIVAWDPRGVGGSRHLDCGDANVERFRAADPAPNDQAGTASLTAAARSVAEGCAATGADLLPHMGTDAVAADLEQIRRALDEPRLRYFGYSYGTSIGLAYAERHPELVGAMVLDGVVDPTQDLTAVLIGQTTGLQRSLDRLLDDCAADPACPVHDPRTAYLELVRRVETQPLPTLGTATVGPAELAQAAIGATYQSATAQLFLQGLAEATATGKGTLLSTVADTYATAGELGAYLAVLCTDLPHPDTAGFAELARRLADISPTLGPAVANEMLPCASWPAPQTGVPHPVRAAGAPPILVVGNRGDAATPLANARSVADTLQHGVLVTYDGTGHTSYGKDPCVNSIVESYLTEGRVPLPATRCP